MQNTSKISGFIAEIGKKFLILKKTLEVDAFK
jgi:hypothetical protein